MFESLTTAFSGSVDEFRTKLILYTIVGIIALVIINLLLDGIRKVIRGLDTAALGALLFWVGTKVSNYPVVKGVSDLLYLIGGTLFVVGLLVFILTRIFRRKRNNRKKAAAQKAQEPAEKQPPAEEGKN